MYSLTINGKKYKANVDGDTPVLWVLRDEAGLTGTKFGCGVGACGACTIHADGQPLRSCQIAVEDAENLNLVTIEGVSGPIAEAVKNAWRELDVVQCGYCQSGQIMQAIGLLSVTRKPTDKDINKTMNGNACRCATYHRIRAAVHLAALKLKA